MSEETTEWRAGVLAFCAPLLREAAYELWPERQRANAQRKRAAFLEKHAHKCRSCHGGVFVAFHRFAVPSPQDGENCQGSADEDDWHSWEALVLAGEQLKKDRSHTPEGRLCACCGAPSLWKPRPMCWGPGGPQLARDEPGDEDDHRSSCALGLLGRSLASPQLLARATWGGP